jgi:hypothetical protein
MFHWNWFINVGMGTLVITATISGSFRIIMIRHRSNFILESFFFWFCFASFQCFSLFIFCYFKNIFSMSFGGAGLYFYLVVNLYVLN